MNALLSRRDFLGAAGALVVGYSISGGAAAQRLPAADKALGKPLDSKEIDGFLAINAEGSVTIYCGMVVVARFSARKTVFLKHRQHFVV